MENCAIILAAGIGSRLYPITKEYPKSLVKVNAKEILDYQIQGYINAGIKESNIFVVTGYKHEMIKNFIDSNYPEVNEIYNEDFLNTNNMYSLYLGLKQIIQKIIYGGGNFYLFINNADCLYEKDLMYEFVNSKYENSIACEIGVYNEESMKIEQTGDTSIINIAKTITQEFAQGVSIDLYKYSSEAVRVLFDIVKDFIEIKKDLKQWSEVAFPELFKRVKVYPFDIKHKKWVEVDNNDDLAFADKIFSDFDITKKKALICDMDGTLYIGNKPIESAIQWIKENKNLEIFFLTNNTSKTIQNYKEKLNSFGIKVDDEHILTPLAPLITYLKEKKYNSIYLVANESVKNFIHSKLPDVRLDFNLKYNQAVVLTYDTEITYEKLKNICNLLNNSNVEYLATHTDVFCPSEFGGIPDIGSFIKLIEVTVNKTPLKFFGKPDGAIIENILKKYKTDEICAVGDRLYTDKVLADNFGFDFICVLSGETKRNDIQNYKASYPKIVLSNLGAL